MKKKSQDILLEDPLEASHTVNSLLAQLLLKERS